MPEEAQEFLADDLYELEGITGLGDELAIVARYRVVELMRARAVTHRFGVEARGKSSNIRVLRDFLRTRGIDLDGVQHATAIDELRLLNNAIKHEGCVTRELSANSPDGKTDRPSQASTLHSNCLSGACPSTFSGSPYGSSCVSLDAPPSAGPRELPHWV